MSVKNIVLHAIENNPLKLKEAFEEEMSLRIRQALEEKMSPKKENEYEDEMDDEDEEMEEELDTKVGQVAKKVTSGGKNLLGKVVKFDSDTVTIKWDDGKTSTYDNDELDYTGSKSKPWVVYEELDTKVGQVAKKVAKGGKNILGKVVKFDNDTVTIKWDDGKTSEYDNDELDYTGSKSKPWVVYE